MSRITLLTTKLVEIFIDCDDFIKCFEKQMIESGKKLPVSKMSSSEMMAITIYYHHSGLKCFKYFYEIIIKGHLESYFPKSYEYCAETGSSSILVKGGFKINSKKKSLLKMLAHLT